MDDLLDLDFSSSSKNSTQQRPAVKGNPAYGRSSFDTLALATSMRATTPSPVPSSRSNSPYPSIPISTQAPMSASRSASLVPPSITSANKRPQTDANSASSGDAFSSLFGGNQPVKDDSGLSMAEKLARDTLKKNGGAANGGSWPTLSTDIGSIRQAPAKSNSHKSTSSQVRTAPTADPWDFDLLAPTAIPAARVGTPISRSASPAIFLSSSPKPASPASFDHFSNDDDLFPPSTISTPSTRAPRKLAPASESTDSFDLLGAFSQPPSSDQQIRATSQPPSRLSSSPSHSAPQARPRSVSPPPHILGQIVEMGFSITQAQAALLATKTEGNWNVEAALEALVEEGEVESTLRRIDQEEEDTRKYQKGNGIRDQDGRSRGNGREDQSSHRKESLHHREIAEEVLPPRPVGRKAREAAAAAASSRENDSGIGSSKVQEQANEFLAQASKIGFSVFKSANTYWETGRASIQKALDEGLVEKNAEGGSAKRNGKEREVGVRGGRPKWMTEDVGDENEVERETSKGKQPEKSNGREQERSRPIFVDSDEEGSAFDSVLPQRPVANSRAEEAKRRPPESRPSPPKVEPVLAEYRSPHRRPKPSSSPVPSLSLPPSRSATSSPSIMAVVKPAKPSRPQVSATPTQLTTSAAHKVKGNELFKLGQFGDAVNFYTKAIDSLPTGHLLLVPLFNNRATAHLKSGDERGSIEDSTRVVSIVLPERTKGSAIDWSELGVEKVGEGGEEINLKEHLAKALGKRAKAHEAKEKWSEAMNDWKALMEGGEIAAKNGGGMRVVGEGLTRCRKMVEGPRSSNSTTTPSVKAVLATPKVRSSPTPVQGSGEAVKALRNANSTAEAEEDLRLSLKDSVDERINAWKGGKEGNLRALISSLDNVLWEDLGWTTVRMHELITSGQVKVRYVRAIGKVHPDKLNVATTTVEQRMIAGGVFHALNEAFKASR